jgi:hypothetical protein
MRSQEAGLTLRSRLGLVGPALPIIPTGASSARPYPV